MKTAYDEFVPEMLEMLFTLNILPFRLKRRHQPNDIGLKMRYFMQEVEPKVESLTEDIEIMEKVAKTDLRLLIFIGILSRSQSWKSPYSFKTHFMKSAEWFLKTEPLNILIKGLFKERCLNFRLAWSLFSKRTSRLGKTLAGKGIPTS